MLIKQVKEANVCLLFLLSGGAANPINHSTDLAHHLLQQWRPSGNRPDVYLHNNTRRDERLVSEEWALVADKLQLIVERSRRLLEDDSRYEYDCGSVKG